MSETKTCTPEELLAGFAKLSPEDQEKVRAEIMRGPAAVGEPSCCDPATMMVQMMERMNAKGWDPMAMCKEMMEKKQSGESSAALRSHETEGCC